MSLLDEHRVASALEGLDGWERDGDTLVKSYAFADFRAAMAFMAAAAPAIDSLDHHPRWTNTYATVDVVLWSHDVGGITERDVALARALEDAAASV